MLPTLLYLLYQAVSTTRRAESLMQPIRCLTTRSSVTLIRFQTAITGATPLLTQVTDADGYSSTVIYNFDFGAITSKQTPQPNTIENLPGPVQIFAYDAAGRIERVTTTTNNAYKRYVYGPNYVQTLAPVNNLADEVYAATFFDGVGQVFATSSNHPGSVGEHSAQHTIHDLMGRAVQQSNATEINTGWIPTGDDAAGWRYTQQTYDWKGRPLITTNTDGTTKEASYSGCGCAGGEVVTLTDEGTWLAGNRSAGNRKFTATCLAELSKARF